MGLRIDLAGDVAIEHDGRRVDRRAVRGGQPWIAFTLLVLARGRAVSRDELADALWPKELPDTWESALRNALTKVRDLLSQVGLPASELLQRTDAGWSLVLPAGTVVDLDQAEQLLAAATEHLAAAHHDHAARAAERAVAVLGQPLLAGIDGTWLDQIRDRVALARSDAQELLTTALLGAGDHVRAASAAREVLRSAPYRESAYRLLMEIHRAAGNRAEALRTYEQCRVMLAEELGVQPSEATEQAYLTLLGTEQEITTGAPSSPATPPPRPAPPSRHDLVGRQPELERLQHLVARPGLVTLVGPGGVGKSALARTTLALGLPAPIDRRWWVDLAGVPGEAVPAVVATGVGGGDRSVAGSDPLASLRRLLRDEPALVLLDDCEGSIAAVTALVSDLLASCPQLTVVLTSRISAGTPAEQRIEVGPLVAPAATASFEEIAAAPSVQLFVRRAEAASSSFELTAEVAPAVSEICRRLDGVPLAVELAAARVRALSPADIAGYLEERFRLLRRAPNDQSDGRHRSLEDAVRWSYDLLDEPTQRQFDRLSVFAGPFDLAAAAAVCRSDRLEALEVLELLETHSMILGVGDDRGERFALLETLRAFGAEQLAASGGADETRQRHLTWYLRLVEDAAEGLTTAAEATWVRTLTEAFPNLRAAWSTAWSAQDLDSCLRLTAGLHDYAFYRMHREVRSWAADAVSLPGAAAHPRYVRAVSSAAYLAWQSGDRDEAQALLDGVVGLDDDFVAQDALATLAVFGGDLPGAVAGYARAADLARRDGCPAWEAQALAQQAFAKFLCGKPDEALAAASTAAGAASGNPTGMAAAHWGEGIVRYDSDPNAAHQHLEACVALADTVGNRMNGSSAAVSAEELRNKLHGAPRQDELDVAFERLDHWIGIGSPQLLWSTVRRVSAMLVDLGALEAAAAAVGAEAASTAKVPARERELAVYRDVVERVRQGLGDDTYARHFGYGAGLSPEELVARLKEAAGSALRRA